MKSELKFFLVMCLFMVVLISCTTEDVEPKVATSLTFEPGSEGQSAKVNESLPSAIEILVKDQDGNGIKDIVVSFSVTEGSVSVPTATTDENGKADVSWTLGETVGTQTLTASFTKGDGTSVLEEATANAKPIIGSYHAGGVVFWIDPEDDTKGLVVAVSDQNTAGFTWGCKGTTIGGTEAGIGKGAANTELIIAGCSDTQIAAKLCNYLEINNFSDWFLPSLDEFGEIVSNSAVINTTANANGGSDFDTMEYYLTSTENGADYVYVQHLTQGYSVWGSKDDLLAPIRAIRSF